MPRTLARPGTGPSPGSGAASWGAPSGGALGPQSLLDPGCRAPPTRAQRGPPCAPPTATSRCRILLSAVYHSDGKTNVKHLEIYVSDGSSLTLFHYIK